MCLSRIIVKLNSELLSNTAPVNHLLHLDEHIRSKLSKFDGAAGIPIDWFYTARKDGGIQLQELSERQCALAIRLYVGMRESKGTRVRDVVKSSDVNFVVSNMSSWRDNLIVDVNAMMSNMSHWRDNPIVDVNAVVSYMSSWLDSLVVDVNAMMNKINIVMRNIIVRDIIINEAIISETITIINIEHIGIHDWHVIWKVGEVIIATDVAREWDRQRV